VLKSREERKKKFEEVERRAEAATRKFEEKERRRAEEREVRSTREDDGSDDDESDDFIVSDDDDDGRLDMGDEPVAAGEMSKNILESGAFARVCRVANFDCPCVVYVYATALHCDFIYSKFMFHRRHASILLPVLQGQRTRSCV
jgi:hypothetical protein